MTFRDTLKLLVDSIKALPVDPQVKHLPMPKTNSTVGLDAAVDTLKSVIPAAHKEFPHVLSGPVTEPVIDSTTIHDTIRSVVHLPRGFEGILHPTIPQTETWIFITLLLLFFLIVFSLSRSKGMIQEIVQTFFQVKERSSLFSKTTINDFRFRFFLILFSIAVFSLYAFLALNGSTTEASITKYGYLLLITALFFGAKSLIIDLLGFTFLDTNSLKMAKETYFNILSILGIVLFPLLILQVYAAGSLSYLTEIISLIVCILGLILIVIKLFQIFFNKIATSFYILLYLCTLEFVPLYVLYKVYQLIV
ncbi:MAG: DUF4271 domain-containing protein [Paludibacter sp.]